MSYEQENGRAKRQIKYIGKACRWFDRVNGNTYHSVRITRCDDGAVLACEWRYGYGDHYRQTALDEMLKAGWIDAKYTEDKYGFERENNYPIEWQVSDGLKRDMVANGKF